MTDNRNTPESSPQTVRRGRTTARRHPHVIFAFIFAIMAAAASFGSPVTAQAEGVRVTTDEDTPYVFAVADFGFADEPLDHVKIVSLPDQGMLSLDGANITSVSSEPEVTSAELDSGALVYTPPANANGASLATFEFRVNDSEPATMNIDVNAVNDAPLGSDGEVTTAENTPYTFDAEDFGFSDLDEGDTLERVTILSIPRTGDGKLSRNGVEIVRDTTDPTSRWVTKAELDSGALVYTPPEDEDGEPMTVIGFTVNDGEADSEESYVIRIDVKANSLPTGSSGTVSTEEDTPYAFAVADFGFVDDDEGDTLSYVRIVWLSQDNQGELSLNGTEITSNTAFNDEPEVSRAELESGALVFTPQENASGDGLAEFAFRVSDGKAFSEVARQITIDVAAAVDGPTVVEYAENSTATLAYFADGTPTWSLSGTDDDSFNISSDGELSFREPPDYENPTDANSDNVYEITVEATGNSSVDVMITVMDVSDEGGGGVGWVVGAVVIVTATAGYAAYRVLS